MLSSFKTALGVLDDTIKIEECYGYDFEDVKKMFAKHNKHCAISLLASRPNDTHDDSTNSEFQSHYLVVLRYPEKSISTFLDDYLTLITNQKFIKFDVAYNTGYIIFECIE